jgi:hypothetical protein
MEKRFLFPYFASAQPSFLITPDMAAQRVPPSLEPSLVLSESTL